MCPVADIILAPVWSCHTLHSQSITGKTKMGVMSKVYLKVEHDVFRCMQMQAFALASRACQVHLAEQLGQEPSEMSLPVLKAAQAPALPSHSSISLPQVEVASLPCCLFSLLHCYLLIADLNAWFWQVGAPYALYIAHVRTDNGMRVGVACWDDGSPPDLHIAPVGFADPIPVSHSSLLTITEHTLPGSYCIETVWTTTDINIMHGTSPILSTQPSMQSTSKPVLHPCKLCKSHMHV